MERVKTAFEGIADYIKAVVRMGNCSKINSERRRV